MKRRKRKEAQRRGRTNQHTWRKKRKGEERDKGKQVRRVAQVTVVHLTSEVGQGLQKTVSQPLFPDIFKGKGMNGEPQTDYS